MLSMDKESRKKMILGYREKAITGQCVMLCPISEESSEDIVTLRNRPRNLYYLNQSKKLTVEDQISWFHSYIQRDDDIYWCIYDLSEHFIGTIRLYGIELDGETCEEGSYIIDEDHADEAPYAVESKILVLDIAFDILQMHKMVNVNRADNKVINNIDDQLGFNKGSTIQIRDVDYRYRILYPEDYHKNRRKFSELVEYWGKR